MIFALAASVSPGQINNNPSSDGNPMSTGESYQPIIHYRGYDAAT